MDKLESYLESLEELFSSLPSPDAASLKETIQQLWADITRYGPNIPEFPQFPQMPHLPGLGDFEVPPPPPPPIVHNPTLLERVGGWKTVGIGAGVVLGAGLLVGYTTYTRKARLSSSSRQTTKKDRRKVIIILGADNALAFPLIRTLLSSNYIVIGSISTPSPSLELSQLEKVSGYLRLLVLDPTQPDTIPVFLRSLQSTLSRRFPLNNSPGDPFARPGEGAFIVGLVSLLSLGLSGTDVVAPFEHVNLHDSYIEHLTATQITPLQTIQSILPLLRTPQPTNLKNIVICIPSTSTLGLPFTAVQSMAAASTSKAVDVLRREIRLASVTGKAEGMKGIRVVEVGVGFIGDGLRSTSHSSHVAEGLMDSMATWTASEKLTYGPAFASSLTTSRKPSDPQVFVNRILGVFEETNRWWWFGWWTGWGERVVVGAGARTYRLASWLPSWLLDRILLLPSSSHHWRSSGPASTVHHRPISPASSKTTSTPNPPESETDSEADADVESNGVGSGVESSWVSLKKETEV